MTKTREASSRPSAARISVHASYRPLIAFSTSFCRRRCSATSSGHGNRLQRVAAFAWAEKKYSNDLGCWLYFGTKDRSWFRYDGVKDLFQVVPLDPFESDDD